MTRKRPLLGAHVSTAGGVQNAPARAAAVGANVMQVFTKTPSQWREPTITRETADAFKNGLAAHGIVDVVSHDSYLINLASPDRALRQRSVSCFVGELARCRMLGIPYVVTHPGNYMDNAAAGLKRNASAYTECLRKVSGVRILIETTAGTGTALGANFEELAVLRRMIPSSLRNRVGFCADTCHLFSAGYDLSSDWNGVWREWEKTVGLRHLRCVHVNDSKTPFNSNRDRHELIAEGTLGPEPFRRLMRDRRFSGVMKIIETPKGGDPSATDRRMLRRLRAYGVRRKRK